MKKNNCLYYQKGWTLVELVIVMVILVILSSFVMPKFLNLTPEARFAKMKGLQGSLLSALQTAHTTQITTLNADEQEDITLDGKQITMVNGYPSVYSIVIASGLDLGTNFSTTLNDYDFSNGMMVGDYYIVKITSTIPRTITFSDSSAIYNGYTGLTTRCIVNYTEASDPEKGIPAKVEIIGADGIGKVFPLPDAQLAKTIVTTYGNNADIKRSCGSD